MRWLWAFVACGLSAGLSPAAEEPLDYGRDVRPILSENCFHCHGQDSRKRMAGLRLDMPEAATANRNGRTALVPGKPEDSGIYQRITASPARRMPPVASNRTLTPEQIATLTRWIRQGGQYRQHWAFVPPARPVLPPTNSWTNGPIDTFILQRLNQAGLSPSEPAAPAAWLRRVSLDTTGLPPSPRELDEFLVAVNRQGEPAYAAAVDRLLSSPAYGERMAIDWLDVARYADTHGFNNDSERSMWRWRDWVIDAFNRNMPYDRFLTEQLAGDLLLRPMVSQRLATGFGRNHVINSEGGIIDEEYRVEYVADRVRTLSMAWLGLTFECARCHDHKYDPITQKDHYRLFAFFNNMAEMGEDGRVANAVPMMPAPTPQQEAELQRLQALTEAAAAKVAARERHWRWQPAHAGQLAPATPPPTDAALHLDCEAVTEPGVTTAPGLAGQACTVPAAAKWQVNAPGVTRRKPFTFSAWLRPTAADKDVPLLSSASYSEPPAAVVYGQGYDFRLVDGELEMRLSDHFPAYSVRVRSAGAGIVPSQWRHVTVVYAGAPENGQRLHASAVQMYVDGREVVTNILNDGAMMGDRPNNPAPIKFRVGWDNSPQKAVFAGQLDELTIRLRALKPEEVTADFESKALPWALAQKSTDSLAQRWLRHADLRTHDARYRDAYQAWQQTQASLLSLRRHLPTVMVMEESAPRETHVLLRGAYNAPGETVEAGVPEQLLGAWPAGAPKNRLGLAQWLTKPDHPLTSRVVVNRFWQQYFGQGLVKTSENFGLQGESPSHPELLDWLAREFVDSGWNVKALVKQIVLSATYRQSSAVTPALLARDPENRLLARGPRFRLPAEILRDQALHVAGLLTSQVGGPSVFPYQPEDLYKGIVVAANYPGTVWQTSKGADLYRRSLYTFWKRTVPHPAMITFDAPDREFCIVRRSITNTPMQALTLLNDPIYLEAARKLGERALREGGADPAARLSYAFRLATGRAANARELAVLTSKLDAMRAIYDRDEKSAQALLAIGASPIDATFDKGELAAYAAVANLILNLDEVITRG